MAIRWCSRTICARYFARRTCPENGRGAAPLGNRTDQRLEDRRPRLGHTEEMRGSWAGDGPHPGMPEVWLNVGMDYDK
jgi:hypothetical protein